MSSFNVLREKSQGLEALLGRREPFVPEELAPKQIREKWRGKSVRTERSFWHFFDVFGSRFFHAFFSGAFFCTWGAFGAPR